MALGTVFCCGCTKFWPNLLISVFYINIHLGWILINAPDVLLLGAAGFNWCFFLLRVSVSYSAPRDLHRRAAH